MMAMTSISYDDTSARRQKSSCDVELYTTSRLRSWKSQSETSYSRSVTLISRPVSLWRHAPLWLTICMNFVSGSWPQSSGTSTTPDDNHRTAEFTSAQSAVAAGAQASRVQCVLSSALWSSVLVLARRPRGVTRRYVLASRVDSILPRDHGKTAGSSTSTKWGAVSSWMG